MTFEQDLALNAQIERLQKRLDRERQIRLQAEAVAEKGMRQLYERQQELELLQAIAVAANQASTVEETLQTALDRVCAHTGWPVGHVYFLGEDGKDQMVPSKIWHLDRPERFDAFRHITEITRFASGVGLPGRVLASGKAAWICDVTRDANFPRAKLVRNLGVRGGFGFPVLVGKEVAAVLEFFSVEAARPDEPLLKIMANIGTQLGRVIERRRAADALRESARRHQSIVESASEAIILADGEGRIMSWNRGAEQIFGHRKSDILGRPITCLMPEQYRHAHQQGLNRLRATGTPRLTGKNLELHGLRKDGSEFPLELSLATWEAGKKRFFSGIIRDITERKHIDELHREKQAAEAANRAKSAFLANMSHELRTPLNSVIAMSDILLEQYFGPLTPEQKQYVTDIRESGDHLLSLINDVLDLSKVEAGYSPLETSPINVETLLQDSLKVVRERALAHGIALSCDTAPGLGRIEADERKLKQAVFNLLSNAVKFTPDGGRVGIRAESEPGGVRVRVWDTGIGIAPEDQNRIFGEFEQVDTSITRKYQGTGLGLALVKRFIEQHGGRIWLESEKQKGSTFFFFLPHTPQPPSEDAGEK